MDNKDINWKQLEANINGVLNDLPEKIGTVIVNWSKNRFRFQNWVDGGDYPWKPRKRGAKRNAGRAILISSGRLRRSIRIIRTGKNSVTVGSDVPYAGVHNDGFEGDVSVKAHKRQKYGRVDVYSIKTQMKRRVRGEQGKGDVKAHTRHMNMPRRRFLGESKNMTDVIIRTIEAEFKKVLK